MLQISGYPTFRVLLLSEDKIEREIDRWIGAAPAVMWMLQQSAVVKRELCLDLKLLIYQSFYLQLFTSNCRYLCKAEDIKLSITLVCHV